MYALAVQNIPEGKDWLYEVKFDGYRCLAGRDENGVTLWSRRGNLFTSQFPHIARACERLPADTLLDGEIVAIDKSGRISFNLLQHHSSHSQALLFYAFDVIVCQGKSLVSTPLEKRRTVLNQLFDDLGKKASPVCLSRQAILLERVAKEGRTRESSAHLQPRDVVDSLFDFGTDYRLENFIHSNESDPASKSQIAAGSGVAATV